nr:ferritin family protein [Phosphitispora fastidiosa]
MNKKNLRQNNMREKDAILFYQELYNSTGSEKVRDTLSKLLEQEKMHLVELRDSMDEMRG